MSFDETMAAGTARKKETYSGLYEALASLPEEFRVVLVLHYLEGFDLRETGEMLQLSLGTVKAVCTEHAKAAQIAGGGIAMDKKQWEKEYPQIGRLP